MTEELIFFGNNFGKEINVNKYFYTQTLATHPMFLLQHFLFLPTMNIKMKI